MKIGILGTGTVGNTLGTRLVGLGHVVKMGARDANNERARAWATGLGANASHGTFEDAATHGELVLNCTSGTGSLAALTSAKAENLAGKVLVDIANPLDFSKGMPPSLTVCNTDSLAEEIQRAFPKTFVVKALNTMNANLMVNPKSLADGAHDTFIAGNDAAAKKQVRALLESFGWQHIHDLGDLTAARGLEMWLPLWLKVWGSLKTASFNVHVVR